MANVREYICEDCTYEWVSEETEIWDHCPECDSEKPPRPGGLKPIRPNPFG